MTNPKLKEILIRGKQEGKIGWLVHQQNGSPLSDTGVNKHLARQAKHAGLDPRLCKLASSLNRSRHRSCADGPREKRRLSSADQATAQERARQRLSSTRMADQVYAQDQNE